MSQYDDYFTNDDKPFAENFNDALLLSNVFDLTVPIELPRMFNDGEWSTGTGQRKAGVSIIQTEGIDNSNIRITNNSLIANNDATVLITVYPNFNQYGNLQKVYWEFTEGAGENLTVDVLTEQRTALLTNIPNNTVLSSVPYLQQLNKFILRLNFRSGTGIKKLGFIMQNKQQDRYGAEVGISDVNGLEEDLNNLESSLDSAITTGLNGKVDKVSGKGLSTNDFTNTHKNGLEFLMNAIVIEEVYFTTEPVAQPQFMVGTYSNQRMGSAILENKLLFQRFTIGAGSSILLYVWGTDGVKADLPASLKDIVRNKQSQISYSNSKLILELINNNTQLQIRNTGTTSISNGSISYNEE